MAHPDLDALLDPLLQFAQQQLAKHQGFLPFGAQLNQSGEMSLVAVDSGVEDPAPTELIKVLVERLTREAEAGGIRAAGICVDMRVVPPGANDKTDAICVQLEHVEGENVDVYLPYRKRIFGGLHYGQLFAGPGVARIFTKAG